MHPLVLELTGKRTPRVGLEGKFSVYHSAAVAIIHGAAGEREYSDPACADPAVIALRDAVSATARPGIHEDQARVTIRLRDGRVLETFVEHAIGSKTRPMTDAALEAKFRGLADGILSATETNRLIEVCGSVWSLADAAEMPAPPCRPRSTWENDGMPWLPPSGGRGLPA